MDGYSYSSPFFTHFPLDFPPQRSTAAAVVPTMLIIIIIMLKVTPQCNQRGEKE